MADNTSTINFNAAYGDIELIRNDISTIRDMSKVIAQRILILLRTEYLDYELKPLFCMNLSKYLGLGIDRELADTIRLDLLNKIENENIVSSDNLEILYIIQKNIINYRIIISGLNSINFSFVQDEGFKVE